MKGTGWFGDILDFVFDAVEEVLAGIDDGCQHDFFSNFERVKDGK